MNQAIKGCLYPQGVFVLETYFICLWQYSICSLFLLFFTCATSYAEEQKSVKFCGLPMFTQISREQIELEMSNSFNAQLAGFGFKMHFKVYQLPEEVLAAFDRGDCDGIIATADEIFARKNELHDIISTVSDIGDETAKTYSYELVANGAKTLEELEGKRLVYVTNSTFSKTYLEHEILKSKRKKANNFFSAITIKKTPQLAIMDVFFGKADAAIVEHFALETARELNPQINKKLNVILKSPNFYNILIAVKKSKSVEYDLINKALAMHNMRLELGKLHDDFERSKGRGYVIKINFMPLKDLSEMETIIKENAAMTRSLK